ncbi:G5 domain-containing protein [Phototrophicus methaneseepsis]|uniref:G5 domain-containing protein n=1 Tax=Phototrophicus methaneseepsis TaxID=2710758 RepID=A0A7S8ID55_9CHLR|nr:G5 domain-containing protein [Phototrophicus methaneseepsis]QPC81196.1 G5 domain-containing protein [Phototrophicus methaneseepsis]
MIAMLFFTACMPEEPESIPVVSVIEGGIERTYEMPESRTVDEFLADLDIEIGELDRVTPPKFIQLTDGTRITIVRVEERTECEVEEIAYQQRRIPREGLQPDEEYIVQTGKNGSQNVCYRITIEDGVERSRTQAGEPTIIEQPVDELIVYGSTQDPTPIPIAGTLAYINNNNAWAIKGNTQSKQQLTANSDLDNMVMSLSPDGQYLLYTAEPDNSDDFVNELWLINTSGANDPIPLVLTDVLQAEWVPGETNVISYSTGEVASAAPFWTAHNNVWTARIDPITGESLNPRLLVPESIGGYIGWWGTVYQWAPDGSQLAWSRADSVGIINADGEESTVANYPYLRTSGPWSWRTSLSWSWDGERLAFVVHGPPPGSEPVESSPIFNLTVGSPDGELIATVVDGAGMWSSPKFSPPVSEPGATYENGYLAYLRARDRIPTANGEYDRYDLIVADRDGSNARVLFPSENQAGIQPGRTGLTSHDFVWSPDGRMIAVIYLGDLWIIDVTSGAAYQLTFDGQSAYPVWSS